MIREPVTTLMELDNLDHTEITAGYRAGFAGEPEPGGNRPKAYYHGWRNGQSDRVGETDDAQRLLAKRYLRALAR